ncbi:MAG: hypothetical protein FD149_2515 [Rhodospirillaceae bacterium]|nr:MAG: hypothetical protein FD149_2515 [Rhodospirillaceae bacterium]
MSDTTESDTTDVQTLPGVKIHVSEKLIGFTSAHVEAVIEPERGNPAILARTRGGTSLAMNLPGHLMQDLVMSVLQVAKDMGAVRGAAPAAPVPRGVYLQRLSAMPDELRISLTDDYQAFCWPSAMATQSCRYRFQWHLWGQRLPP